MPRPRLNDLMQQHSFWLFDAGILGGNVLFPVFDPSLAFATASTPEITATEHEIVTGNWQFSRRFIKSATVSPIVLGRGVRFYDSDMYNWITAAILGKDPVRRSLCLMHFLGLRSGGRAGQIIGGAATGALTGALSGGLSSAAQGAVGGAILGGFINNRIPGRLWMLHDCFDEETEILGRDGWVGPLGVAEGDEVYSMNLESGRIELTRVEGYVRRPAGPDDHFIEINGRSVNFSVTGRHGFYIRRYGSNELRRITADELFDLDGEYQVPVAGEFDFPGVDLSDDELRLIAWYITDGHMKDSRLVISQAKERKNEIRALLGRLELHFTERILRAGSYGGLPLHQFGIPKGTSGRFSGWGKRLAEFLDKNIARQLHQMNRRQFEVFWTELVKGDGNFRKNDGVAFSQLWCSRKEQADALTQMAVLRGFGISCGESVTENGHRMYILYPRERSWSILRPKRLRQAASPMVRRDHMPGEHVWCVSNRNKTVIARRGGKIMIVGNCIPTRYKAGGDFDASSGAVSIQELEVQPEHVVEVTVSTLSGVQGAIGSVKGAINVVEAL
jgi:hypothetical protein